MKVVAVGECTVDRYLTQQVDTVGGISLNFAVNARRAGATAALVSAAGTDSGHDAISALLAREGADATHLHQRPGATASQAIHLRAGERIFPPGGYTPGVLTNFQLSDNDRAFIAGFDIVAAPLFSQIEHLFHAAMQAARPDALRVADLLNGADLGPGLARIDPHLPTIDLLFISGDHHTIDLLLPRSRRAHGLIVVTMGARGSAALDHGRVTTAPAVSVPVQDRVDTTGCGDAFQAAFTVAWHRNHDIPAALRAGALQASRVIRHLGALGA